MLSANLTHGEQVKHGNRHYYRHEYMIRHFFVDTQINDVPLPPSSLIYAKCHCRLKQAVFYFKKSRRLAPIDNNVEVTSVVK